jgi:hypothetical protein
MSCQHRLTRNSAQAHTERDKIMTNAIAIRNETFSHAINAMINEREMNASNVKKMRSVALLAARASVAEMLLSAEISASRFDKRAMYATEKCVKFVAAITKESSSVDDFELNSFVTFKTILNAIDAKENLLFSDIQQCILISHKVDTKRAHIIYARRTKIDASAQVQQCIDMLKTLNVIRETAKNVFAINAENTIVMRAQIVLKDLS